MGCRVRERLDCLRRAAPPLGRTLRIDHHSSAVSGRGPTRGLNST
ncbi:short-chain fatty acyl-CoA regulator family protein [Streptomyces sp. NPDC059861]